MALLGEIYLDVGGDALLETGGTDLFVIYRYEIADEMCVRFSWGTAIDVTVTGQPNSLASHSVQPTVGVVLTGEPNVRAKARVEPGIGSVVEGRLC